jgi:hypothetical protein
MFKTGVTLGTAICADVVMCHFEGRKTKLKANFKSGKLKIPKMISSVIRVTALSKDSPPSLLASLHQLKNKGNFGSSILEGEIV